MASLPPTPPSSSAIEHLNGGYERLTQLRALLLSSSSSKLGLTTPTIGLLDKALSSLAAALSKLQTTSSVENCVTGSNTRKRRKKMIQSWTIVTSVPHFDGHQWRKYGQKRIDRAQFPRSYFKCTYGDDQGCPATKTVQRKEDDNANPPKYEVSYSMHHTCKSVESDEIPFVMNSSVVINNREISSPNSSISGGRAAITVEPMLHSAELRREEGGGAAGSSGDQFSPLFEVDFDWEWMMC